MKKDSMRADCTSSPAVCCFPKERLSSRARHKRLYRGMRAALSLPVFCLVLSCAGPGPVQDVESPVLSAPKGLRLELSQERQEIDSRYTGNREIENEPAVISVDHETRLLSPPKGFRIVGAGESALLSDLPHGNLGIAALYPGDRGIENDPAVIFVENFDGGLDEGRWDTVWHPEAMSMSGERPEGSAGLGSLLVEHVRGEGGGGYLYRRLPPGYERIFVRYYVKFDEDCAPMSHFGAWIGGYNPPTAWPQGGAGSRPEGDQRFTTAVEPYGDRWGWDFYTYWQDMHVHGDGNYWGTPFLIHSEGPPVRKGEWICVETMVKLNDPVTASNGEQAFWINGELFELNGQTASHFGPGFPRGQWTGGWWQTDHQSDGTFSGFRWRSTEDLKINFLWMLVYNPQTPEGRTSRVWFDHIVVATEYIGPIHVDGKTEAAKPDRLQ